MSITRIVDTDSDGTPLTGSVHNNAWLQAIYQSIEDAYMQRGTFVPAFLGSSGQSGQVYGIQYGRYLKIDLMVFFRLRLALTTLGTITGDVQIALPFPAANLNAQDFHAVQVGYYTALGASFSALTGQIAPSATALTLNGVKTPATGTATLVQADLTSTTGIIVSGSYEAAS